MDGKYVVLEATVTPDNDAYTANDCVGGLITFNLANAGAAVAGGILSTLQIVDDDNEGAALNLYFFDSQPSTIANDAALALTAADLKKITYYKAIAAGDYTTVNSLKFVFKDQLAAQVRADGAGKIYMYVQCTGTPTYAANKTLYFRLGILSEG